MAAKLERKTAKVADVGIGNGRTLQVIRDFTRMTKPLLLYVAYYENGWHRRKIMAFDDMASVLRHMLKIVEGRVQL